MYDDTSRDTIYASLLNEVWPEKPMASAATATTKHQRARIRTHAEGERYTEERRSRREAININTFLTLGVSLIAVCRGMCNVGHSPGSFPVR